MPTAKPRLMVTLEPETYNVLMRLARVQSRPASAIVREVLDGSTEALSQIADTMEALERLVGAAKDRLATETVQGLESAQGMLQPHLDGILDHFRAMTGELEDAASSGSGPLVAADEERSASEHRNPTPPKGAASSPDPQPVIRGSGSRKSLKSLKAAIH